MHRRLRHHCSYLNTENSLFCHPPIHDLTLHSCTPFSWLSPRWQACTSWCGRTSDLPACIPCHIWCVLIKAEKRICSSITPAVVLDSPQSWARSLSLYFEKTRCRRGHLALMSPRRYKQYLRRHRFTILVHGTEAEHPVHLRKCRVPR